MRQWARDIADQQGFRLGKLLYEGLYYHKNYVRNGVWGGIYQGKPAVLKVYDDPRVSDEPVALTAFHKHNRSNMLTAPKLYASETISPRKGWLIMEKLPDEAVQFSSPLSDEQRQEFLRVYVEYRHSFISQPTRELTLAEQLPAHEYVLFRLSRWFALANNREEERAMSGEIRLLDHSLFIPLYDKAVAVLRKELQTRRLQWCHGHFKPKEVYKVGDNRYYLIDFAHSRMYQEGYELGFIVWSDWLMGGDWRLDYPKWKKGIDRWLADFKPVAEQFNIERPDDLLRIALLERTLGSILADVTATDRPREEAEKRNQLLIQLMQDLL